MTALGLGVSPLTTGGKDDLGWRGRQHFQTSISGQGFPDKYFRTSIPGQVFPDKPAGSYTTHVESIISRLIIEGRRASLRVWDHGIPNPWRYNLTIVKKYLETRNTRHMEEKCLIKMESLRNQLEIIKGLF